MHLHLGYPDACIASWRWHRSLCTTICFASACNLKTHGSRGKGSIALCSGERLRHPQAAAPSRLLGLQQPFQGREIAWQKFGAETKSCGKNNIPKASVDEQVWEMGWVNQKPPGSPSKNLTTLPSKKKTCPHHERWNPLNVLTSADQKTTMRYMSSKLIFYFFNVLLSQSSDLPRANLLAISHCKISPSSKKAFLKKEEGQRRLHVCHSKASKATLFHRS